jgi:hypothetical protein
MKIKDAVTKRLEIYQQKPNVLFGVIGNLSTGIIEVPGKTSIIYVTLKTGVVLDNVLNVRVPNLSGLEVKIGYDPASSYPGTLQVLGVRDSFYGVPGVGVGVGTGVGPVWHHKQHEWPSGDTVYVRGEQFLPSMYYPVVSTLTVDIYPNAYRTTTGWKVYSQITNVSLADSVTSITTGCARFAVIVADIDGIFAVRDGDLVAEQADPFISAYMMLTETDIPELEDGDRAICAAKLYYGQTALRCTGNVNDFVDLRFVSTGGGTGGGHVIQDEGVPLDAEPNLDFAGAGVTVTDVPGSVKTLVTIPGGGHVIQDEGTPLAVQPNLNFKGTGVLAENDPGNAATMVTIEGAPIATRAAVFTFEGRLTAVGGTIRIYNKLGVTATISQVYLTATVAPTGAAIIVDVHKNGTTIFTNQAHRPQIADGAHTGFSVTVDDTSWADGDYLSADMDQVGSTYAGEDLTVHVIATFNSPMGEVGDMLKSIYDTDDDGIVDDAAAIAGTTVDADITPGDAQVLTWVDVNDQWEAKDLPEAGIEEAPIDSTPYSRQDAGWVSSPSAGGDVYGDAVATDEHLAVFDTDGYHIKDGGTVPAGGGDVVGPADAVDGNMAVFDTTTGKLIRDGGAPGAGGGHVIQDEGTPLAAEPNLDFAGVGVTVTDVPGSSKTLVTIPGGGGGADFLVVQVFS